MTVRLETVLDPGPEDTTELVRNVVASNDEVASPEEMRRLAVFAREGEVMVGGVAGHTHWTWLFVGHLWVAESHRGHGLGSSLLSSIEHAAVARDATDAHLDTYDFQALPFYEANGYEQFGQLDEYPAGHSRHFLHKRLR